MDEKEIYVGLTELFRDIFMRDDIILQPETTAADVSGWNSLKQIEILMGVEEKYGVRFVARELDSLRSVGDLARAIASKVR